jgi:hypothetical protein
MKVASPPFAEAGLTGHTGSRIDGDLMHEADLAFAPGASIASTSDTVRFCRGIVCLLAIGLAVATLPLAWLIVLAVGVASAWALAATVAYPNQSGAHAVPPAPDLSQESCEDYRAILVAIAELDRAVAKAPRLRASVASSLEHCRDAVAACGPMARQANLLQQYLDRRDPAELRRELERMCEARGDATVAAMDDNANALARQLATYDEIAGQRDLIRARLKLVRAPIESFTATIVKLRGLDERRLAPGDRLDIGQLDGRWR